MIFQRLLLKIVLILFFELSGSVERNAITVEFNLFKYAYMVAIFYEGEHVCNGVLFSPTKVLTVSDCLTGFTINNRSRFELDATVGTVPRSKAKRYKLRRWKIQDRKKTTFALGSILNFVQDFIASAKFLDSTSHPTQCNLLTYTSRGVLKDVSVSFAYCPARRYHCFDMKRRRVVNVGSPVLCEGSVWALHVFEGPVSPKYHVLNVPESLPWIMSDIKSQTSNLPSLNLFHLSFFNLIFYIKIV